MRIAIGTGTDIAIETSDISFYCGDLTVVTASIFRATFKLFVKTYSGLTTMFYHLLLLQGLKLAIAALAMAMSPYPLFKFTAGAARKI